MSDNYEFMKASEPQSIGDYSPYSDKQSNQYINDLNNGVYTNNSLTLLNFDLGQIYNSQKFTDTSDLMVVLPIVMVAAYADVSGNTIAIGGRGQSSLLNIKSNFINLVHQADLTINGKTIESTQPFINIARNFQLLSEMSVNDLVTIGPSLGFADTLDTTKSMKWNGAATATTGTVFNGNGWTNNKIYGNASEHQHSTAVKQNSTCVNVASQFKQGKYLDISSNENNYLSIVTQNQLNAEFRPYYEEKSNYMVYYDYAVIKLSHVFESLAKINLVRRFDATVRLWINTGTVNINVTDASSNTLGFHLSSGNNTFSNTCPLMVNHVPSALFNAPTGAKNLVAGLYIAKPPTTSMAGINLASSNASHPLLNCRLYYNQITLQPEKSLMFVEQNRNKKVVYRSVLSNIYTNIASNGTFNALVNAGIVHPTGVLVIPYISSSVSAGFGDYQWKSPFDSCPFTSSPCSLTNFNVQIGGSNILQTTLSYNFEHFLQQVNLAEQLTSADFGVSTGLISQEFWQWSKFYYCNVERSNLADKLQPRNVNITFNNNSNVAIDILVFIFYNDEMTIDVETGIVTK
jgi:hypothetical protein